MRSPAIRVQFIFTLLLTLVIAVPQVAAEPDPSRVITLGGDITEIVYALGAGDRVVGRDATSRFPAKTNELADVGYFRQLNAEGVLSLKPDLILASASAGPPEVLQQISATGVKLVQLEDAHSAEGLLTKVQEIAKALHLPEKGDALATQLSKEIDAAKAAVAKLSGTPKVLFVINAGGGAPMAAGRDTAADVLIKLAGGENVFSSHEGYKAISLEAAVAAAPEAIAMMEHTFQGMGGIKGVAQNPALRFTPAAKEERIFAREGSYLLSFGPRLPEAIIDFAKSIRAEKTL